MRTHQLYSRIRYDLSCSRARFPEADRRLCSRRAECPAGPLAASASAWQASEKRACEENAVEERERVADAENVGMSMHANRRMRVQE